MTSFPMGFWNGMRIEKLDGDAVSDWADAGGRDGIMLVNNSQTQNTFAGITIRRPGTKVSRIAWEGREEATPCCGVMIDPTDGGVTVSQWLAPGQMELFMLD